MLDCCVVQATMAMIKGCLIDVRGNEVYENKKEGWWVEREIIFYEPRQEKIKRNKAGPSTVKNKRYVRRPSVTLSVGALSQTSL